MRIKPGQNGYNRWKSMNKPPPGEGFVWLTCEMLMSPAWLALTAGARRIIDRIAIEHMQHKGTMNGELTVTYNDFQAFGVSRKAIRSAIEIARKLGFIDITVKGARSHGVARRPSKYGLTWLPRNDGSAPSNRWRSIKTREDAVLIAAGANERRKARKGAPSTRAVSGADALCEQPPSQDI